LFDRYFHDVLVDPQRYRYGGPEWFAKFLSRIVPEPDLIILLDAHEEAIFSRKEELPLVEIGRQRETYRQLQFKRAQKVVVETESGIGPTLVSTSSAVAEFMRQRLVPRMRDWGTLTS
jgi:adenylate kinase